MTETTSLSKLTPTTNRYTICILLFIGAVLLAVGVALLVWFPIKSNPFFDVVTINGNMYKTKKGSQKRLSPGMVEYLETYSTA